MKQFFKMVLATMVGFILSYVVVLILALVVVFGLVASVSTGNKVTVSSNSVLLIRFDEAIQERSPSNPFQDFNWRSMKTTKHPGLDDILSSIKTAATDSHIKGIYIDLSSLQAGVASIEEIRNALLDFKKSKKFIYTYGENYTQGGYYLASVSDKIFLNPQGMFDWKGLHSEMMFFKGSFEKLEIEPQIIRHGKYKSFIEPFVMDKMSPENREQLSTMISSIWNHILEGVGSQRKISTFDLNEMAGNMSIRSAEDAVKNHLVDSLTYTDGMYSFLRKELGLKENQKINFVKLSHYIQDPEKKTEYNKNKIALIYAVGGIKGGQGDDDNIGSDQMSETIRKARLDSNIKAIVLRVNSPGGSAQASDIIWREVELAKKVKPVVVSMGDVAASGGYYIACAANKIYAEPNTITGSIGVLGIMFNGKKFLNDKLGITVDTIKTGRYSDFGTMTRPMSEGEKAIMQHYIENIYDVFVSRVAIGRNMKTEEVDKIGQGRVWIGLDAKRIGLVDEFGGVDEALIAASKLAHIEKYKVISLPEKKDPFSELIEEISGDAQSAFISAKMGEEQYRYYKQFESLLKYKGIQARMPYTIDVY